MKADSNTSLFDPSLISPEVQNALPTGFYCRPLQRTDYSKGHLDVLRVLAHISDISEEAWIKRFDQMKRCNGTYFIAVIVQKDAEGGEKIAGTGTLIVGLKFLNDLGDQGHLEDISIAKEHQGKKLGKVLIQVLDDIGAKLGCYKNILNCREGIVDFYLKCGYERRALQLHKYLDEESRKHGV